MRKLLCVAGLASISCGCTTDYSATYQTNCEQNQTLAVERLRVIAQETSSKIGAVGKVSEHPFNMMIQISGASPSRGQLWFSETSPGIVVGMMLPGNGSEDYARKIKSAVEDSLSRNCNSPWTFQDQTHDFHFSK